MYIDIYRERERVRERQRVRDYSVARLVFPRYLRARSRTRCVPLNLLWCVYCGYDCIIIADFSMYSCNHNNNNNSNSTNNNNNNSDPGSRPRAPACVAPAPTKIRGQDRIDLFVLVFAVLVCCLFSVFHCLLFA